jgi:hypothetical protein
LDIRTHDGFERDETPVVLENRGDEDAVNIRIEPIQWALSTVTFDDVHRQCLKAKGEPFKALPTITSTDPGVVETTHNLVSALIYDYRGADWFKKGETSPSWPFRISYDDLRGNSYETVAQLKYSRDDKHLWVQHNEARPVKRSGGFNPGILSINIGR